MRLKIKKIDFNAGRPIAFLNQDFAKRINFHVGDRIEISHRSKKIIAMIDITKDLLLEDEISLSDEITNTLKTRPGEWVDVHPVPSPKSINLILKKLNGGKLSKSEIYSIVQDIVDNALTEAEIAYFVSGVYQHGMTFEETLFLTEAMYKTGYQLIWKSDKIADKHSIGGVAGNRTTPVVVSICAAAGIIIPKTSSRAITSAAGTADVIETVAKVDFPAHELKKIVDSVGACLAWNGSFAFAPADDLLIRVEKLLNVDPEAQLIASILSKKLALGSKYIMIDIPYGDGAKVSKREGLLLRKKFLKVAKHFKLKMQVVLTKGDQPIGNGIGPVLEMIDVLKVLKRENPPKDLENKCLFLSGVLLELLGKAKKGKGKKLALEILNSKRAYKKFEEIITAQGRKRKGLILAKYSIDIKAERNGKIHSIDNKKINYISRVLGCPNDKSAGIYLYKHKKDRIKKGEKLLTLYSESRSKLDEAKSVLINNRAISY